MQRLKNSTVNNYRRLKHFRLSVYAEGITYQEKKNGHIKNRCTEYLDTPV